jgi:hypothetical protein
MPLAHEPVKDTLACGRYRFAAILDTLSAAGIGPAMAELRIPPIIDRLDLSPFETGRRILLLNLKRPD